MYEREGLLTVVTSQRQYIFEIQISKVRSSILPLPPSLRLRVPQDALLGLGLFHPAQLYIFGIYLFSL